MIYPKDAAGPHSAVRSGSDSIARGPKFDTQYGHLTFVSPAHSRRAVVSYWRKYVHLVLVNCFGLNLLRNNVVRLTDCLEMIIAVKQQNSNNQKIQLKI